MKDVDTAGKWHITEIIRGANGLITVFHRRSKLLLRARPVSLRKNNQTALVTPSEKPSPYYPTVYRYAQSSVGRISKA